MDKPEMTFIPKINASLCGRCFRALPASVRKLLLGSNKTLCEPGTETWMEHHAREIRDRKGREYTVGSDNRLDNFDLSAKQLGLTPEQVLAIFAYKHWASILTYCKDPSHEMSEPIEDRIADMINYLLLLYLMTHRRKK